MHACVHINSSVKKKTKHDFDYFLVFVYHSSLCQFGFGLHELRTDSLFFFSNSTHEVIITHVSGGEYSFGSYHQVQSVNSTWLTEAIVFLHFLQ